MIDAKLKKDLDKVFSKYVRLKNANKNGLIVCYTCGIIRHWKDSMDCGHWIPRNHTCTRWELDNVRPQCRGCNRFGGGKYDEFAVKLGKEGIKITELVKKKHSICKIDNTWIKEKIAFYTEKVKEYEQQLGM